jgi:hypothetical protein
LRVRQSRKMGIGNRIYSWKVQTHAIEL